MPSIAISPESPPHSRERAASPKPSGRLATAIGIAVAVVATAAVLAVAGLTSAGVLAVTSATAAATEGDWPVELGPVLSWQPDLAGRASCSVVVDRKGKADFVTIQAAVDRAAPGNVVCVRSLDHRDELVHVRRSGRPGEPIELRASVPAVTAGFVVEADDVVIRGFTVDNGGVPHQSGWRTGFHLSGMRLAVIGNTILDPGGYGIHCDLHGPRCGDVAIIGNTVRGADGIGINVAGRDILVEGNDVAGSLVVDAGDADGIRFFGERILIRRNYIHHIFDRGYAGEGPHTDCFQTFDSGRPSTRDVVIEENICFDVDHQCLMAEAPLRRESAAIVFRRNICANNGSQGVLVREIEGVVVEANIFMPTIHYNAVVLRQGVQDARIACNLVIGRPALDEVDRSSLKGLVRHANRHVAAATEALASHAAMIGEGCSLAPLEPWLARAVALAADLSLGGDNG